MLIVILAIIGLSLLILGHEAGHFFAAKLFGLKVDEFGFGFPPRMFAWRPRKTRGNRGEPVRQAQGETEYSLNWLPFGGFVRIAGENDGMVAKMESEGAVGEADKKRLFYFQAAWKKFLIVAAGVATNFVIGWFLLSVILMVGTPKILVVGEVQKNSPAEQTGLLAGDIIKGFTDAKSFVDFTNLHRGQPTPFTVMRDGRDLSFTITPRVKTEPNEGAIGVLLAEGGEPRQGFFASIWEGLKRALWICGLTITALYNLVKNLAFRGSLLEGVVGPVGIFSVAQEAGRVGIIYLVQLASLISLNLAVVNLIPFPALDGGRLLLVAIEKIKKSPIPWKAEAWVNAFGFALLIALMALLTVRDVGRFF